MNKELAKKEKELEIRGLELSIQWKLHELEKIRLEEKIDFDYYN